MRTTLCCTLVILSFIVSQTSFAIDYKFTGNGSWSDVNNWDGGLKPPSTLEAGNTITIYGTTSNGKSCGEFCSSDLGRNLGTITIAPGGSLTLNSANQFSQSGIINVEGTLINQTVFQAASTGTVNVSGTFVNQIFFGNQGHLIINDGGVLRNEVADGVTHMVPFGRGVFTNDFINPGKITLNSGGTIHNTASGVIVLGNLINNGGTVNNSSILKGNPIITGNLFNADAGTVAPGNSPGTYTINGDYTAVSSTTHAFEVDGTTAGTYDVLNATGTVNLNGAMNISLKSGVTISGSTEVSLITGTINGTFSSTTLPDGLMLDYRSNSVVLKAITALPVRFVTLEAAKQSGGVQVSWRVADEKGVLRYEIEKSTDGSNFLKTGTVLATLKDAYNYVDYGNSLISYYRIKSIDADGRHGYSQIIFLKGEINNIILKAFIAASGNELLVQHPTAVSGAKIYIHSIDGRLLKVTLAEYGTQQSKIAFPFTNSRIYVISYVKDKEVWKTTKVYKP